MLLALLAISSCYNDRQAAGTITGSMLGSIFGSSIGGIIGGPRGSDVGTLIGMAAGAAVGNAATAPRTDTRSAGDYYYQDGGYSSSSTYDGAYSHEPEVYGGETGGSPQYTNPTANVEITNLRFVDTDKNQHINGGERCQIIFNIRNNGASAVYDVAPVLTANPSKRIHISPTAIVESISARGEVRYTAHIYAEDNIKESNVSFVLQLMQGNNVIARRDFTLQTARKNR